MALLLGAAGVGFVGQLNSFFLLLANFTSLGNNVGVTRLAAAFQVQGEKDRISRLLFTVSRSIIAFVVLCVLLGMLFSHTLSKWVLSDEKYFLFIVITLIGLPFTVSYNLFRSFFTGLLEIRTYVISGVMSALVGLILLLPLIYFFNLAGAVWHIAVMAMASLLIAHCFLNKLKKRHQINTKAGERFDRAMLGEILKFGAASLTATTSLYAANLMVRMIILNHLGFAQAGIYAAMLQLSNQCVMLVLDSINTYCYPRLSGLQAQRDIIYELNEIMRLTLTLVTPIIVLFVLCKEAIIVILLSHEFMPVCSLIGLQLLGDALKAVGWSIGVSLLPLKKLKAFAAIDVGWSILFISLSALLVPAKGLTGALIAYLTAFVFHVVVNYFYVRKTIGYTLWPSNKILLGLSLFFIVYMTTLFRWHPLHGPLLLALAALWIWKAVKPNEVSALLRLIKEKLAR